MMFLLYERKRATTYLKLHKDCCHLIVIPDYFLGLFRLEYRGEKVITD